ncbi:MAG: hypothetical protein ABIO70_27480 [Pseudomonadota bacterium]
MPITHSPSWSARLPGAELAQPQRGPSPTTLMCGDEPMRAFARYEELEQACGREYTNEFGVGGFVNVEGDLAVANVHTFGAFSCRR